MKKLIIVGTGKIAEVVKFYFETNGGYEVVCFSEDGDHLKESSFSGLPVIPLKDLPGSYPPTEYDVFVAIGYKSHNRIRALRFEQVKSMGYHCPTYISPHAIYYGTPVGENCMIFENNVIQPFVEIGNDVFLWSGNHIGHHSKIQDHCFISSHVVVSGNCTIQNNCFLGVNATLRDGLTIGPESVIGAGAIVMADCEAKTLVLAEKSIVKVLTRDII